jgi:hypothetical protein
MPSHLVAQGAVAEGTRAAAAASAGKEESDDDDDEALAEDDEPVEKADSVFNMQQLSTVIREACNSARLAAGPLTPSSAVCCVRALAETVEFKQELQCTWAPCWVRSSFFFVTSSTPLAAD